MATWLDVLRAEAATLPPESPITLSVQWRPDVPILTDDGWLNPAYVPAQQIYTSAGDLASGKLPPIEEPPSMPPTEKMTVDKPKLNGAIALNVRSEPGTTKEAINKVYPGQVLEVRGSVTANTYHWAELVSINGVNQSGYVAREYLKPA